MATLTVRNVPDEVHRALRVRAAEHGRSAEAEVRAILAESLKPQERVRMGDALATLGQKIGIDDGESKLFDKLRDRTPAEPIRFE
ncbi:FitA-like ribbon-helix-helix domain-containing protein [Hoeflea poritis]|uniref:Arc family DNA-binding protein n=1 Tax=Hoeflea poritis TaxID=2993659 RepID=A0ABT4VMK0_9HYPH|nr:Arc family DNA-binding protein [Hoeflea poritis]MDA4845911.1 Arc family DNA-binding protein [Hoeflea poritis]